MSEYIGRLLSDTDKLIAALEELERSHKHFSVIKYKLNKQAGKIADLVTSCRRSIAFMADDPALKPLSGELEKYGELLKSYHGNVKVTGGLCSSDKYRIKRAFLLKFVEELKAAKADLAMVASGVTGASE